MNMISSRSNLRLCVALAIPILLISLAGAAEVRQPMLDASYPGGNIITEKVEANTYFLKTDLRDTRQGQWWFYWNFRVQGAGGHTLHFRFTERNPFGVCGPALSRDGGLTWRWMGAEAVRKVADQKAWEFSFSCADDEEVRFSFAIPYLQSDLQRFLARHRGNSALVCEELCRSRKGRSVERLRLGKLTGGPQYRVLLTARHHACESLASYVLEGIMEAILADTPEGRIWRERMEVMVVPFVDKDGVEEGDQGKARAPHDHNRDYGGKSIYPEVAALREQVPAWLQGKPVFALDFHCPYLDDQEIQLIGGPDQAAWAKVMDFSRLLESTQKGPLHYRVEDNLPFGKKWNVGSTNASGGDKRCDRWTSELPEVRLASCLEFPYAKKDGEVSAESARTFGNDLAHAIVQFLTKEKN